MQSINKHPARDELLNFGLLTGALTPLFFGLLLPWLFDRAFPAWPWIVGAILIAWALTVPMTLNPLYRIWMTIGYGLGWVNTRIILTVMFYLIILPAGAVMRLLGNDPMTRTIAREQKSYRVTSSVPDKQHVERPY